MVGGIEFKGEITWNVDRHYHTYQTYFYSTKELHAWYLGYEYMKYVGTPRINIKIILSDKTKKQIKDLYERK